MIIFIKTGILDTLDYFIDNMACNTPDSHILTFTDEQFFSQLLSLDPYIDETTYVITFNNAGAYISVTDRDGQHYYWDMKHVQLYSIQVDAPVWYKDVLDLDLKCMHVVSVDKTHANFVIRHFAPPAVFLPHGGVLSPYAITPYESRNIDILYLGTKQSFINSDAASLSFFPDNGKEFMQTTLSLLYEHPFLTPEQLTDLYFKEAGISNAPRDNYIEAIDTLYRFILPNVRSYYQEQIISALAEAHFHVTIYGDNWNSFGERHPEYAEYVHINERTTPEKCIELICNSKITFNIQPWFKEGAHERIYNAMLNESVCVTDTSKYLERQFQDGENIVFYNLSNLNELAEKVRSILQNPEQAKRIIHNAKQLVKNSTWHDRLENILNRRFTEGKDFI